MQTLLHVYGVVICFCITYTNVFFIPSDCMSYMCSMGVFQPIHLAAALGHFDILKYLSGLPQMNLCSQARTVCIILIFLLSDCILIFT